jgi:hypothetical protein
MAHGAEIVDTKVAGNGWLPKGGTISQGFGTLEFIPSLGIDATHQGIDVAGHRGDPVTLPANTHATVTGAGWDAFGGGNFVQLLLDDGSQVELFHLQDVVVKAGQDLTGSNLLGHMDSTGASTGDHLHFQVNQGGKPVDPWNLLMQAAGAAATSAAGSQGGSLNPFDAFKNVNDFFGHLIAPGHDPCSPPQDEMGVFKVIDGVTCPQNWWKVGISAVGVVLIGIGVAVYFFQQERQAAITIVHDVGSAAEVAAIA